MKIRKEVYPPFKKKHSLMFRAEKSLLENMQTYLLQPNEWQYVLQCAWVVGFGEGRDSKEVKKVSDSTCTEDSGDMWKGSTAMKR